jgi:sarcosine oxidase subunit beta
VARGVTDVTVLDARYIASGSSGRSIGIIETQYLTRLEIELRAISLSVFAEHEARHGLPVVRNGYLRLGRQQADVAAFERSVDIQRELGLTCELLEPGEITRLVPDLYVDDFVAGLWGPRDGFIDGHLYANLLAGLAQDGGAKVRVRSPLRALERGARHRHRLLTDDGSLEVDVVVNAAGPWAEEVGRTLGVNAPLRPQRHQVVAVHLAQPLEYVMPSVIDYVPGGGGEGLSFRYDSEAQLLACLHSEEVVHEDADPHDWYPGIDGEFVEVIARHLAHRLPGLTDAALGRGWAGLYPVSPDGLPQAGPSTRDDSIFIACGVGGYGIQVAPVMGRLLADWITGVPPAWLVGYEVLQPQRLSQVA